jgi:hypothetical protein
MRALVTLVLLALGAWLIWFYFHTRLPAGMVAKGGPEAWKPWVSLVFGVVSTLAALANFYRGILDIRLRQQELERRQLRAGG